MLLGLAALVVLVLPACNEKTTDTSTVVDEVKEAVGITEVADAPEGCPKSNDVVVQSKEAGTVKPKAENSYFSHWRDDSASLIFANYDVDTNDLYSGITGDNVLTVVKLYHLDATTIEAGTFSKVEDANQSVYELNISTESLAGGVFDDTATVELTYLGEKYACGTITSDDTYSSINGTFIAEYIQ